MILKRKFKKYVHYQNEQEELTMGKKTKKKDEIVIINKFKENSAEDVRVSISKIFEMFYNMQLTKK